MRAWWALVFVAWGNSCLDPTEITVEVTTSFDCPAIRTGLVVGGADALERSDFSATKDTCVKRRIGDLVIVPRETADASVYVRIVAAIDNTPLDVCTRTPGMRPAGAKCIEAKRIARFVRHSKLRVPVLLSEACINVDCGSNTCVDGRCTDPCMETSQCMDAGTMMPPDAGPQDTGPPIIPAQAIYAGFENACALVSGELFCWGANATKQLGALSANSSKPSRITLPMGFGAPSDVAIGAGHICATNTNGTRLACWGNNIDGQSFRGTQGTIEPAPADAKAPNGGWILPLRALACEANMTCVVHGTNLAPKTLCAGQDGWNFFGGGPSPLGGDPGFTKLAAGRSHMCGESGGYVYCWGENNQLQIGNPTNPIYPEMIPGLSKVDFVFAGWDHSAARHTSKSAVAMWGRNGNGEIDPTNPTPSLVTPTNIAPPVVPLAIGQKYVCMLDSGKIRCRGDGTEGQLGPMTTKDTTWWDVSIGEMATSIAPGRAHVCALGQSGAVYCWGAMPAGPGSNQPQRIVF